VTLPNGTYYFQAIFSGNGSFAGGKSPCTEVLTVAPPCVCAKISAYANAFHHFGNASTRWEFNIHSRITCTVGAGGCAGGFTLTSPGSSVFIDTTKAKNGKGVVGLKLKKSTAKVSFACAGPCATTTTQQTYVLQIVALETVKIVIGKGKHRKTVTRTVQNPAYLAKGRAKHSFVFKLTIVCNGTVTTKRLVFTFDKHGNLDYKTSDLNGDGIPDGKQLNDLTGFV
jgi:hypothetical protein